jgi:threonine dehydrogenase-like Zn-dependent dehydrogenase
LQRAAELGADQLIASSDPVGQVRMLTENRGADVTIEAVGKPETWELAVRATRKGGRPYSSAGAQQEVQPQLTQDWYIMENSL